MHWSGVVTVAMLACLFAGCRAKPKPFPVTTAPTTKPVEILKKPAIDLSRSGAGFPLETTDSPTSILSLKESLQAGYKKRLTDESPILLDIAGEDINHLDRLHVNLSDAAVRAGYQPANLPEPRRLDTFARVKDLIYTADPMNFNTYTGSMIMQAADADLGLVKDSSNKLYLVLKDCSAGSAQLKIDLRNLEKGLASGTRVRGLIGFTIDSVGIDVRSQSEQSIEAVFTIEARVLMIPAKFRLTGRADVDNDFRILFSHLSAEGDDPTGAMIAALVQARLDKLNNKAAPLLRLPGDRIRITDFSIKIENELVIDVKFAGTK